MKVQLLVFIAISLLQHWKADSLPIVAKSRQLLPPLPGYIPVYIRPGNTPLEDINLDLAEAFESYALKQGRINSIRSLTHMLEENVVKDENDISSIALDNINLDSPETVLKQTNTENTANVQHIQKIPKFPKT